MRQCIVSQMVAKAAMQLGKPRTPEFEDEQQEAIQRFFDKNPNAFNNGKLLADFAEAITGYKPVIQGAGCQMWSVWCFKNNPDKMFLTVSVTTASRAYGIYNPLDTSSAYYFDAGCDLVPVDKASKFINEVVAKWTDAQVVSWVTNRLGGGYIHEFMSALDDEHHC